MKKEIEKISNKLHDLKLALYMIACGREGYTPESEDPLVKAAELIEKALVLVDNEFTHSDAFLLLKTNGEISRVTIPLGEPEIFNDKIHELIGCQYYELVSIKGDCYFIVDELGKVCKPPKEINRKASLFYPGTNFGDPIVGDVIIAKHGYVNGEPDAVGLDEEDLRYFEDLINSIKPFLAFFNVR